MASGAGASLEGEPCASRWNNSSGNRSKSLIIKSAMVAPRGEMVPMTRIRPLIRLSEVTALPLSHGCDEHDDRDGEQEFQGGEESFGDFDGSAGGFVGLGMGRFSAGAFWMARDDLSWRKPGCAVGVVSRWVWPFLGSRAVARRCRVR